LLEGNLPFHLFEFCKDFCWVDTPQSI
jgi:hypothetical protein